MADVKRLLESGRLVTVVGSGGCGKTRLALQVGRCLAEEHPGCLWLVDLAPLTDPSLVPQTVAAAIRVREDPAIPITDTIIEHLKARNVLLIVDNAEHVLSAVARLAEALLRSCPRLRILATSRESLGVAGETTYRIPSLPSPDTKHPCELDRLLQYEAVRLFIDRAMAVVPSFSITNRNATAVAQLCAHLDGIPMAIELAAARVRVLPVEQMAARLDDRFRLLTGGSRTALPRHQTLRALIDWSYDLLSPKEAAVLRMLSVFAGGWTLEAAEAICATPDDESGVESWEVLDLLAALVEKSLAVYEDRQGSARYRLLETVRQYAREKLTESPECSSVRGRHATYFLRLAEKAHPEILRGSDPAPWLAVVDDNYDNLRAALNWSGNEEMGLRLGGALWPYWRTRGFIAEGRGWLDAALGGAREAPSEVRALACTGAGGMAWLQGDYSAAAAYHAEALRLYGEAADRPGMAFAMNNLGVQFACNGDISRGRRLVEESLEIYRDIGDTRGLAFVLNNLGVYDEEMGDFEKARAKYRESAILAEGVGEPQTAAQSYLNIGEIELLQGSYGEARRYLSKALKAHAERGDRRMIAISLVMLAGVRAAEGDPCAGARLLGAAEAMRIATGIGLEPTNRMAFDRSTALVRMALDEDESAQLIAEGRAMPPDQAVKLALLEEG